jgi:pyridoxal phosphate-dependent aminotransferase EpsN
MPYRIPLSYNPIDVDALTKVLRSYEGVQHNQIITDFENELATLTASHVVATNSGTAAIHLALLSLGIGPGDIVIAPTFTYVATINPILYVGATPVLVDCERETWNMDPALLEQAIDAQKKKGTLPKAIIIVHTYGMPAQMQEIMKIADREGIDIIEDAAESLGATYQTRLTGTFGRIGIYSFNNNKAITTYGGGALITKDSQLAEKARFFASQAREDRQYYEHRSVGFNYLMSSLNAAMGLSQLPHLFQRNEDRRKVFERYRDAMGDKCSYQSDTKLRQSNRWLSAFVFADSKYKNLIANNLKDYSIETRPLWKPMHSQPIFEKLESLTTSKAEDFFIKGLCLPSSFRNSDEQTRVLELLNV